MTENSGIILIDKPRGFTSQDAVNVVRRLYGTRECGHAGTLDPMATGLLVVLVGRAVKASEYAASASKTYVAEMKLGIETDTEDTSGTVLAKSGAIPEKYEVLAAVSSFFGESLQTPPMYSAKKVGGKKLVDIARSGNVVEREPVKITVSKISAEMISSDTYSLIAEVSKGTYIRTLCADIGRKLGCGAAMSALRRTAAGGFSVDGAYTLEALGAMSEDERRKALLSVWSLFRGLPVVQLPAFYDRLAKNGAEIYESKVDLHFKVGQRLILADGTGKYALAEVKPYPDGAAVKALKFLETR